MADFISRLLDQFSSPIGVGILILILTNFADKHNRAVDQKNNKISLLDDLHSTFSSTELSLESLKQDGEKSRFEFKNRDSLDQISKQLQSLQYRTYLLGDRDLKRTISEHIELMRVLTTDINGLELYYDKKNQEFTLNEHKALEELRQLKLEAIKLDMQIDKNSKIRWIGNEKNTNEKRIESLQNVYDDLDRKYILAKEDLKNTDQFCKDRRVQLIIRVVDAQTKTREVVSRVETKRDQLITTTIIF